MISALSINFWEPFQYNYKESHCKDRTVPRLSYLYHRNPHILTDDLLPQSPGFLAIQQKETQLDTIDCWTESYISGLCYTLRRYIYICSDRRIHMVHFANTLCLHSDHRHIIYIILFAKCCSFPLQWRHNDHECVSNHQPRGCLLNRLFRPRSKKTSKLRVTGLCVGNSPGPVNSPHKGPVTRKCFHLMTSSCERFMNVHCWCTILTSHKCHGISNHLQLDCLCNRLRTKKSSFLTLTWADWAKSQQDAANMHANDERDFVRF